MRRFWFKQAISLCGFVAIAAGVPVSDSADKPNASVRCLESGHGYFRARISGSIDAELNWGNEGLVCAGGTRPDGGVRVRFSHAFGEQGQTLAFLFGIPSFREARPGRNMPVNLTVIREGAGEFFGTTGEDKCSIDELKQEAILGVPRRQRSYRVIARGFCMQPAPGLSGKGAVLITRFDFSGKVDFTEDDSEPEPLAGENPKVTASGRKTGATH